MRYRYPTENSPFLDSGFRRNNGYAEVSLRFLFLALNHSFMNKSELPKTKMGLCRLKVIGWR